MCTCGGGRCACVEVGDVHVWRWEMCKCGVGDEYCVHVWRWEMCMCGGRRCVCTCGGGRCVLWVEVGDKYAFVDVHIYVEVEGVRVVINVRV